MTSHELPKDRGKLEHAIASLEAQRATLGDAVVDTAISALHQRLAAPLSESPTAPAGERKLVTVMFADIAGFTALAETLDPEAARDLMNACFERLVPIVEGYEGTVDKFMGDGLMVLFGAPLAHENDPERALRAALEMVDELDAAAATDQPRRARSGGAGPAGAGGCLWQDAVTPAGRPYR